jgi:hypothetical protein
MVTLRCKPPIRLGPAFQAAKEEDFGQEYRNAPFEIVEFHC